MAHSAHFVGGFLLQLEGSTLEFKLLSDLDKDKDGATEILL